MIDLHNHLLPGLDDGPPDLDGSLAMARAAVDAGISTMACTPHVARKYPNRSDRIRPAVEHLRGELADAGIPLEIVSGAEISTDVITELDDAELRLLSLNDARLAPGRGAVRGLAGAFAQADRRTRNPWVPRAVRAPRARGGDPAQPRSRA